MTDKQREERRLYMQNYRARKKAEKQRIVYMSEVRANWNTACQWLDIGYVVNDNAISKSGYELQARDECWFSNNYNYYYIEDCTYNPEKAKEEDSVNSSIHL